MTLISANTRFATLKDFQVDTVEYALRRLYDDPDSTDRFLVADEVGMGKTLVARGVIAGAIDRLKHNQQTRRIDIIYICSNAEIARQNIAKLDVGGDGAKPLSTRITMLATQLRDLNREMPDGRKTVNLVAFTPGTSFETGKRGGRVEERALLYWLLRPLMTGTQTEGNALQRILRMDVNKDRWKWICDGFDLPDLAPDVTVAERFRASILGEPVLEDLRELVVEMCGSYVFTWDQDRRRRTIVASLRRALAQVSVSCLEPDLVILDEFQRFKHLLEHPDVDTEREVSQLAHDLFTAKGVKVLLLSATPYKMFTLAEERDLTGEDHYADFLATIDFLENARHVGVIGRLKASLAEFRRQAITRGDPRAAKEEIERLLRKVMCRTERPVSGDADMLISRSERPSPPSAEDLLGFVAMKNIARTVGGQLSTEYWKSAPYFLNFMDGYQLSERFRHYQFEPGVREKLLKNAQVVRRRQITARSEIEPANSRLRQLIGDTVDHGWWRLLWVPPSMLYYQASGPFATSDLGSVTKRLIFSSWAAAPSAIASIASWAVLRRIDALNAREAPTKPRFTYRIEAGRPAGMTTLALFLPTPGLAKLTDPLAFARESPDAVLSSEHVLARAKAQIVSRVGLTRARASTLSRDTWFWVSPFAIDGGDRHSELAGDISEKETATDDVGLAAHLDAADQAARGQVQLTAQPEDLSQWVALLGLAGPANVAWRSLRRVTQGTVGFTDSGLVRAAAIIGAGFRSLFNRPEVMALLDSSGSALPYWQVVLQYCYAGNLQAVMDEYLHHLIGNTSPANDYELLEMADGVRAALSLRIAILQAFDPSHRETPMRFNTRFALRYGSAKGTAKADDKSLERMSDVKEAFNSPFWPFVLATTSIGQEGVDLHWWCHSIVHWNLPANPFDFEQREGRVNRFKGHAVRKNVAAAHRQDALRSKLPDPWAAAFQAAERTRPLGTNDLWPWWAYPGVAKIERLIPSFPLSKDQQRELRLQRGRALYRLAFGQPRQEDLLTILDKQGYGENADRLRQLRIDLRPPKRQALNQGNTEAKERSRLESPLAAVEA